MIRRGLDVKLNVKPVFLGLEHQYYYEGPCRFAKGEALTPEYEKILAQELKADFFKNVRENVPLEEVNLLDPLYLACHDDWIVPESAFEAMTENLDQIDCYIISGGIARSGLLIELAQRTHKPIIQDPMTCCDLTAVTAVVKNMGLEIYPHLTYEGIAEQLRVLRVRKALKQANILCAVRFDSTVSKSGNDTFLNLQNVTEKFGTHFRYLNIHELFDYLNPISAGGNYTTPGRMNTPNVTEEDMKKAEALADELLGGAEETDITRENMINSCLAFVEVQKLLDIYDCCGFTIPCPDTCSTRRLNEMKFTFCLTHSLNNELGIPSACEYDIDGVLTMLILSTLSGMPPYMGNTNPLVFENGTIRPMRRFNIEDLDGVKDLTNLYHTSHSTPNRYLKSGIGGEKKGKYAIRHFAYDQGFGAVMRYDFKQDEGQVITLCRISPDCKKLFVGKGTIVSGGDYDLNNCNGYVVFRVQDQNKFFKAQCYFGNHLPLVYGDYVKELEMLGECLGLEVVSV